MVGKLTIFMAGHMFSL